MEDENPSLLLDEFSPALLTIIALHPVLVQLGELLVWWLCKFGECLDGMLVDFIV